MSPPKVIGAQSAGSVSLGDKLTLLYTSRDLPAVPLQVTVVTCWPQSSGDFSSDFMWNHRESEEHTVEPGAAPGYFTRIDQTREKRGIGWLKHEGIRWAHGWSEENATMLLAAFALSKAGE